MSRHKDARHSWRRVGSTEAPFLEAAIAWLEPILAAGPIPTAEVMRRAAEAGIAARTAYRALHALGGRTRRRGYGGPYFWELRPQAAAQPSEGTR